MVVANVEHLAEGGQLGNHVLHHGLVLLAVQVGVLQGGLVDDAMHLVDLLELVPLEGVGGQLLHDDVAADHIDDELSHRLVLLHVVGAAEGPVLVHAPQLGHQPLVGHLQVGEVELVGGLVVPALKLEHGEHLADVIGLVERLAVLVGEGLQDVAHLGQVLNEALLEGLLAELGQRLVLGLLFLKPVEVVQVEVALHEVDGGLHGARVDGGQLGVGGLGVLHVLLLEVLQLARDLLLEGLQVVGVQLALLEVHLDGLENLEQLALAVEVVLVRRVSHLVLDAVDLDPLDLAALEHHRAHHCLVVACAAHRE